MFNLYKYQFSLTSILGIVPFILVVETNMNQDNSCLCRRTCGIPWYLQIFWKLIFVTNVFISTFIPLCYGVLPTLKQLPNGSFWNYKWFNLRNTIFDFRPEIVSYIMRLFKKQAYVSYIQVLIDSFTKRHRLVHNGGFPKFEALHCSPNMTSSTEIS